MRNRTIEQYLSTIKSRFLLGTIMSASREIGASSSGAASAAAGQHSRLPSNDDDAGENMERAMVLLPPDEGFVRSRKVMTGKRVAAEITDRRFVDSGERIEDVDADHAANRIMTGARGRLYEIYCSKVSAEAPCDLGCLLTFALSWNV